MTIQFTRALGLDVSKASVCCHCLDGYPVGGVSRYWQKTRNQAANLYPVFWSFHGKKRRKTVVDFLNWLDEQQPEVAVLEPTGNHYSRLWAKVLEAKSVPILWVGHIELKRYREGKNLPGKGKNDAVDALAMAAYPFDPEHRIEDGSLNRRFFLFELPASIGEVREICQQLEHLDRVQSPCINYSRQVLSWQFPEVALAKSKSKNYVPPLWGWLANHEDLSSRGQTQMGRLYAESIAPALGIEIDPIVRLHAQWLCEIDSYQKLLDERLMDLLALPEFELYHLIFDEFGFGLRSRARVLSRVYPFESFLLPDGSEWIEREVREVKHSEKRFEGGTLKVKFAGGDVKRVKRNRSRDVFKMRLGMGTILESSGDDWVEKAAGSSLVRKTLWQHTLTRVERAAFDKAAQGVERELIEYRDKLKSQTDASGRALLRGRHVQGKLMSKIANLLYRELKRAIARPYELG